MEGALVGRVLVDVFDDVDLGEDLESIRWFRGDEGEIEITSPPFGHPGL
jgi:hypothetical protein